MRKKSDFPPPYYKGRTAARQAAAGTPPSDTPGPSALHIPPDLLDSWCAPRLYDDEEWVGRSSSEDEYEPRIF